MIFYMFSNTIATFFLNLSIVTVLTFNHPIDTLSHGLNKTDLFVRVSKDKKTLILKPLSQNIDTNMVVVTSGGNYNFNVKITDDRSKSHSFIQIQNGDKDNSFALKKKTRQYEALEGKYTVQIINKSTSSLQVNGEILKSKANRFLPKGPPIFINGKREIY
jgi:type IV secretory pathway VirB9-like protein